MTKKSCLGEESRSFANSAEGGSLNGVFSCPSCKAQHCTFSVTEGGKEGKSKLITSKEVSRMWNLQVLQRDEGIGVSESVTFSRTKIRNHAKKKQGTSLKGHMRKCRQRKGTIKRTKGFRKAYMRDRY